MLGLGGRALEAVGLLGGADPRLLGRADGALNALALSLQLGLGGLTAGVGRLVGAALGLTSVTLGLILALLAGDLVLKLAPLTLGLDAALLQLGALRFGLSLLPSLGGLALGLGLGLLEPALPGQLLIAGGLADDLLGLADSAAKHSSGRLLTFVSRTQFSLLGQSKVPLSKTYPFPSGQPVV